ncbi:MAG: hypothetical protein K8L91_07995 [Anaerolineae bacterium]|nr:hypothetical protein [Anaerolineae bacterium]
MPYPYADTRGIIPGTAPNPSGVFTAVDGIDDTIENVRIGDLSFQKLRLELHPIPLVPNASGAINVIGSYHLVRTTKVSEQIFTINGVNQGDVLILERASNSGHIVVGEFLLHRAGAQVMIKIEAVGFNVLGSTGKRITPAFKAYRATGFQLIAATTDTVVQFNATSYNQPKLNDGTLGLCYSTSAYNYVPGATGLYLHRIQITWAAAITAGVNCFIYLQKAGVTIAEARFQGKGVADQVMRLRFQDYMSLAAGYQVLIRQNEGGAASRNMNFGVEKTWWTATRLGAY